MARKIRLRKLEPPRPCADRREYEERLEKLQVKMLSIQQAYFNERRRAVVVVEGWDAAGKGGMIRRVVERLDPRGVHVWPIGPPTPEEQGRHYLNRFWAKLPEPGTLVIFDRSWYGRVLVERVDKLAGKSAWKRAYDEINAFERMLVDDGIRLVKIFLHISPDEQLRRFAERLSNPYKRWKLTEADIRNHQLWNKYVEAIDDMFDRTATDAAPWTVIAANMKWSARLAALDRIVGELGDAIDLSPKPVDPEIRRFGEKYLRKLMQQEQTKKKDLM